MQSENVEERAGTPTDQPIVTNNDPAPVHLIHPVLHLNPNVAPFQQTQNTGLPANWIAPWPVPNNWIATATFWRAMRKIPRA
jgi:hypothetical protein